MRERRLSLCSISSRTRELESEGKRERVKRRRERSGVEISVMWHKRERHKMTKMVRPKELMLGREVVVEGGESKREANESGEEEKNKEMLGKRENMIQNFPSHTRALKDEFARLLKTSSKLTNFDK